MKRYWNIGMAIFAAAWLIVGWTGEAVCGSDAPSSGINPRANFWRGVREGEAGTTTSASEGHKVLIQNGGQNWRQIRNGPIAGIAPWLLAGVVFAIGVFFAIVGRDRLEEPRSGVTIPRFSLFARILHWSTAVLFILLALTGLSMLFGRAVLIPAFGQGAFAAYMQAGLLVHNFSGPLFFAGVLVEAIAWAKDNIPEKDGPGVVQEPRGHGRQGTAAARRAGQRRRKGLVLVHADGGSGKRVHRAGSGFSDLRPEPSDHANRPHHPRLDGDPISGGVVRSHLHRHHRG